MATMAALPLRNRMRADRLFHSGVAVVCAAILVIGFARTWFPARWLAPPDEPLPLVYKVHGVALTAWLLLGVTQPLLIAGRNRALHRRLGYASLALAPVLMALMIAASITALSTQTGPTTRLVGALNTTAVLMFGLIYGLSVFWRRRTETHKRLATMLWTVLVGPGLGRTLLLLHAPLPLVLPISDSILVAGAVFDKATRGRVHPVWRIGGPLIVAGQVATIALAFIPAWARLCSRMAGG